MSRYAMVGIVLLLLAGALLTACGGGPEPATTAPPPPQEQPSTEEQPTAPDGESLVAERCAACHGLARIQQASKTEAEWEATVTRMVGKGADLNAEEQAVVIQYLAETYGP